MASRTSLTAWRSKSESSSRREIDRTPVRAGQPARFFYGVSRLISAGALSLPLRSTAEIATSSAPPITGRGILRNLCKPGITSVVQLRPTRVRTTHSQTGSVPCGWIETVLDAEPGSRPTRTTGVIGGVLSIHVDAGTSALSAYGPEVSFSGRLSLAYMKLLMLK